jgi:hypothetical protein
MPSGNKEQAAGAILTPRMPRWCALLLVALYGCGSEDPAGEICPGGAAFQAGDPEGHADPFGARAAGQARAGRLRDEGSLVQPAHGRQQIEPGDFVLANDRIAVTIEAPGPSDGYDTFGGKILAVDSIGEDGRPEGRSHFVETLLALGLETLDPTSVSVVADGSDGGPAIVRATGKLTPIPFLAGALSGLFPEPVGLPVAFDYVLEPGSDKVVIRLGLANSGEEPIDFSFRALHGFFHYSRNQLAVPERGFDAAGTVDWTAHVSHGDWSFAWRAPNGGKLEIGLEISGFVYALGPGFVAEACGVTWRDHAEVIGGGPDLDGLAEAVRRADDEPGWRPIDGSVRDASGTPVPRAWVHLLAEDGAYLARSRAGADGSFRIHAPPGRPARLVPFARGYPLGAGELLAPEADSAELRFAPAGAIRVAATEAGSGSPLPVRIQVVPAAGTEPTPAAFGLLDERNGRLHIEFSATGQELLVVPPGDHRVVVSRGYEYELFDQTVSVAAGATVELAAVLERSVETPDHMCADFHIHSFMSADANDSIDLKVRSAVADGLEIPVSSEHEWIVAFQPTIEALGLESWAFGPPSEELTTFTWGHFGVVPILPRPGALNNGAIDWVGKLPAEVFGMVRALPENPVLIVNHPSGGDFASYFSQSLLDPSTGKGMNAELWSEDFDAVEVFNDSDFEANRKRSVRDWFALLNAGKTVWAVGSSDSHHVRTSPVGYPRTCMYFGFDDPRELTIDQVKEALGSGRSTVSGGLTMTVEGPEGAAPGSTLRGNPATAEFTVSVSAPGWVDATTLEVIVNGVTQAREPLAPLGSGPGKRFVNPVSVTLDPSRERNWVVFHARGKSPLDPVHAGRYPFAVSNPIFFLP